MKIRESVFIKHCLTRSIASKVISYVDHTTQVDSTSLTKTTKHVEVWHFGYTNEGKMAKCFVSFDNKCRQRQHLRRL